MNIIKLYRRYRDKWWSLPLILPILLLPLARWANTVAVLNGNEVYLYYLPLALVLSLMLFFGWAALPGGSLSVCCFPLRAAWRWKIPSA